MNEESLQVGDVDLERIIKLVESGSVIGNTISLNKGDVGNGVFSGIPIFNDDNFEYIYIGDVKDSDTSWDEHFFIYGVDNIVEVEEGAYLYTGLMFSFCASEHIATDHLSIGLKGSGDERVIALLNIERWMGEENEISHAVLFNKISGKG